jgi:hypothetical protein
MGLQIGTTRQYAASYGGTDKIVKSLQVTSSVVSVDELKSNARV